MAPQISIVTATFNRSNVLRYAIESVLRQTRTDWEMIIVGDHCTDDTESLVASFQDSRLKFINLPENHGEQSVPNNIGVAQARGAFLAFLNHDDMWLPNHLARSLEVLEAHAAEFVAGSAIAETEAGHELLGGIGGDVGPFRLGHYCPASLWVMRTAFAARVGPWRSAFDLRRAPSHDWLVRAYRCGAKMVADPVVTAIILPSRAQAYAERAEGPHAQWAALACEPDAVIAILSRIGGAETYRRRWTPWAGIAAAAAATVRSTLLALGIVPPMPRYWLRHWRRGHLIASLRRTRGLPATTRALS